MSKGRDALFRWDVHLSVQGKDGSRTHQRALLFIMLGRTHQGAITEFVVQRCLFVMDILFKREEVDAFCPIFCPNVSGCEREVWMRETSLQTTLCYSMPRRNKQAVRDRRHYCMLRKASMRLDQLSHATITRIAEEVRTRLPVASSSIVDAEFASLNYDPIEKNTVMEIRFPFMLNVLVTGEGCARRSINTPSDTSESSSAPSSLEQSLSSASESEGALSMLSSSPKTAVDKRSPMKLNNHFL
uniref:Uncharacterized protein n=1 Tax=Ascaris lumbricoides TaxID=6252 RepID=A0A9J2PW12_ASCLU